MSKLYKDPKNTNKKFNTNEYRDLMIQNRDKGSKDCFMMYENFLALFHGKYDILYEEDILKSKKNNRVELPVMMSMKFHSDQIDDQMQIFALLVYVDAMGGDESESIQPPASNSTLEYYRYPKSYNRKTCQLDTLVDHVPVRACFFHVILEVWPRHSPACALVGQFFSSLNASAKALGCNRLGTTSWMITKDVCISDLLRHYSKSKLVFANSLNLETPTSIGKYCRQELVFPRDLIAFMCSEECDDSRCGIQQDVCDMCLHFIKHPVIKDPDYSEMYSSSVANEVQRQKVKYDITSRFISTDWGRRIVFEHIVCDYTDIRCNHVMFKGVLEILNAQLKSKFRVVFKKMQIDTVPLISKELVTNSEDYQQLCRYFDVEHAVIQGISRHSRINILNHQLDRNDIVVCMEAQPRKFYLMRREIMFPVSFSLLDDELKARANRRLDGIFSRGQQLIDYDNQCRRDYISRRDATIARLNDCSRRLTDEEHDNMDPIKGNSALNALSSISRMSYIQAIDCEVMVYNSKSFLMSTDPELALDGMEYQLNTHRLLLSHAFRCEQVVKQRKEAAYEKTRLVQLEYKKQFDEQVKNISFE